MKMDEMLYDALNQLKDDSIQQMEGLDQGVMVSKKRLKKQKNMALTCIQQELMERADEQREKTIAANGIAKFWKRFFGETYRRSIGFAALILVFLVGFSYTATANDWDIKLVDELGMSNAMQYLPGGYVKIDQSCEYDGIVMTVSKTIGDKNSQYIQLDTNVPYESDYFYEFDEDMFEFSNTKGNKKRLLDYSMATGAFDNNGKVSFLYEITGCENINRANMNMMVGKLRKYTYEDDDCGELISEGEWSFQWKNYYLGNETAKSFFHKISFATDQGDSAKAIMRKIELTPISIQIKGWWLGAADDLGTFTESFEIDSFELEDGTIIDKPDYTSIGAKSNRQFVVDLSFSSLKEVGLDSTQNIKYITIRGKKFEVR